MKPTIDNLLLHTIRNGDCLEWTRAKQTRGYGVLWDGKQKLAHRVMYELANGPIPDGLELMHSCDNPSCINLAHLSIGTHKENMYDRDKKGRSKQHTLRRLTDQQVSLIRASNDTLSAIASEYNVSRTTIWKIKHGCVYKAD